jgi:hypothetical protein
LIDLPLLFLLSLVLPHKLVADQSAGNEPDRAPDQSAGCGMTHGAPYNRSGSRSQSGADKSSLLTLAKRLRTPDSANKRDYCEQSENDIPGFCHESFLLDC